MRELTLQQMAILERLRERGYAFVAFPMYAQHIGVKKGNCAALLAPQDGDGLAVYGEPSYLVAGQMSVRIRRGPGEFFVWKKNQVEATAARREELERFRTELTDLLLPVE